MFYAGRLAWLVLSTHVLHSSGAQQDGREGVARKRIEKYPSDCVQLNGRVVRECQVRSEDVPAVRTVSVCGTRVERNCLGPCFNCQTNCRPQFEKQCISSQPVRRASSVYSSGGLDYYEEKGTLEPALLSCSSTRVGQLCAPVNCRFVNEKEDCVVKNETEIVTLTTRTCSICLQKLTEVFENDVYCEEDGNCSEDASDVSQTKASSPEGSKKGKGLSGFTLQYNKSIESDRSALQKDLDSIFLKSLDPVNNLILDTLRKIKIEELNEDTVVIIPTARGGSEANSSSEKDKLPPPKDSVNINVKYEFELAPMVDQPVGQHRGLNPQSINNQLAGGDIHQSGRSLNSQSEKSVDGQSEIRIRMDQSDLRSLISQLETENRGSQQTGESREKTIYFDPFLQTLNDRERQEISRTEQVRPSASKGIIFPENSAVVPFVLTSSPPPSPSHPSSAPSPSLPPPSPSPSPSPPSSSTSLLESSSEAGAINMVETGSTGQPSEFPDFTSFHYFEPTESSVEPSSAPDPSTPGSDDPTTHSTLAPVVLKPKRKPFLSSSDLLKLCFLHDTGCDFSQNEIADVDVPTATAATTIKLTTTTTTAVTAATIQKNRKGLGVEEKVRLCFQFGFCSEAEIRDHLSKSVDGLTGAVESTTSPATRRPVRTAGSGAGRTTRPPSRTSPPDTEALKAIKEKAMLCIWTGVC